MIFAFFIFLFPIFVPYCQVVHDPSRATQPVQNDCLTVEIIVVVPYSFAFLPGKSKSNQGRSFPTKIILGPQANFKLGLQMQRKRPKKSTEKNDTKKTIGNDALVV